MNVEPNSAKVQDGWLPVTSWVLYDVANTIYASFLTYMLVPQLTGIAKGDQLVWWQKAEFLVGTTQTTSMFLSAAMVPVMGALCDRTAQTRLYLNIFTLACIGAMLGWGFVNSVWAILLLLAIGNLGYQNALSFYTTLLPSVASPQRIGTVSGLGVGLGYLGTILTLVVALALKPFEISFQWLAIILGTAFLLLAAPCMIFVREMRVQPEPFQLSMIPERFSAVLKTVRSIPHQRALLLFFLGNFFLVDVLNTAILFFGSFTLQMFKPMGDLKTLVLAGHPMSAETFKLVAGLFFCILAMLSGLIAGALCDRFHPLRVMRFSGWCLLAGLSGGIAFAGHSPLLYLLSMCGAGGFGMAGIWTSGRLLLFIIVPREKIGEYNGLYGITLKLSVVGAMTFGIAANWGQQFALGVQIVPLLFGLGLLYGMRISDAPINGGASPR